MVSLPLHVRERLDLDSFLKAVGMLDVFGESLGPLETGAWRFSLYIGETLTFTGSFNTALAYYTMTYFLSIWLGDHNHPRLTNSCAPGQWGNV